jgi:hypothetical protein
LYRLLLIVALHGGVVECGWAPHYAKGVMDRVSRNRDMPPVACMVSSPVWPIGTRLWVYGEKTGTLLHCRVTDVSQPRHRKGHIARRIWVELDWAVTEALCGSTRERVIDCPVVVVQL